MAELTRFGLTVDCHATVFSFLGPNPYVAGGIVLDLSGTEILVLADISGGFIGAYDYTTQKLKVLTNGLASTVHAEVGAVDLSAVTFRVFAITKP
jgi:hypothetical protein